MDCQRCHTSIDEPRQQFGDADYPVCFACHLDGATAPWRLCTCPECNGHGRLPCDACDGKGKHECQCGDEHDCAICYGVGRKRNCSACDGSGKTKHENLELGGLVAA